MTRKTSYKTIDYRNYGNFLKVAENFIKAAELAFEFEYYNAAGVLIIHAAIALADSITIRKSSKKSSGENHFDVLPLLTDVAPYDKNKAKALENLKKLIEHKNFVSYSGDIYGKQDVEKLLKYFNRFKLWADSALET